jgi:hypothetical protein
MLHILFKVVHARCKNVDTLEVRLMGGVLCFVVYSFPSNCCFRPIYVLSEYPFLLYSASRACSLRVHEFLHFRRS